MAMARKIISKEEIVEKLKDDGDFDRLRLKIIRRLKENEELRNNMISVVKESTALNRPGAQNMKTRQLTDAIFEEVGSKMLSQLSDGLWGIIRSEDGMKNEIRETVQSVYATLTGGVQDGSSFREAKHNVPTPVPKGETSSYPHLEASKQKQKLIHVAVQGNKAEACSSSSNKVNNIDNNNNISDDEDPELPPGFG
ncbi:hypothetical protein EUTSA_v10008831mg [Eutrema salsugineum]|uniref:BOD1/SHG1 domain-containing protein n=1 Tax=Eutrema salsugineum TaxID=72664 RepID=V4L751_EUTSA|nr:uncharacterized protein LOC18993622 [Eutrema salsugineum]ESQ35578.1 hypothetical protein EUTSA_v10008831mg [Eutrema salsugineum]